MINLMQGDCIELMKSLPDSSVDLVLTDPPYLFNKGHGNSEKGYGTKSPFSKKGSFYDVNGYLMSDLGKFGKEKIYKLLDESKRVLKNMRGYYFCNDSALPFYLNWAMENNCKYTVIVLHKAPFIMNRNRYATNCEFIVRIVAKAGAGIKVLNYENAENDISWLHSVQKFEKPTNKLHPAQKPQNILNGIIYLNTNDDEIVLDPFMGSGSTGVACVHTGRRFIGMELDEKYFEIAENRIRQEEIIKMWS